MYQAVEDVVSDPEFTTFTINRDRQYIIPAIKDAIATCDKPISVLLSPWSPPAAWKTAPAKVVIGANAPENDPQKRPQRGFGRGQPLLGRPLKAGILPQLGRYMVKYIQAYLDEGIRSNGSRSRTRRWPSPRGTPASGPPEEEKVFLRDHLYPEMLKAGLVGKVGIYIWDHNKERIFERACGDAG